MFKTTKDKINSVGSLFEQGSGWERIKISIISPIEVLALNPVYGVSF
jgi:hypothetical protein